MFGTTNQTEWQVLDRVGLTMMEGVLVFLIG